MSEPRGDDLEMHVLVLAPTTKDAEATRQILAASGIAARPCADLAEVCREVHRGAGALLLSQEAVLADPDSTLAALLIRQPSWSDLPLIVLTAGGVESAETVRSLELVGNATLVQRPVRISTLVSTARSALRHRRRQYQARDDLAGREQRAAALREANERLSFALAAGNLGSWELDLATGELISSPAFKENFGIPPDGPFEYGALLAAIHPEDRPAVDGAIRRSLEGPTDYDVEYRNIWPDGTVHWVMVRGRAARDRDGRPTRLAGVSLDITERKRSEDALRDTRVRLESALAAGSIATWTWDITRDRIVADASLSALFGVSPGEVAGGAIESYLRAIHPEDRDRVARTFASAVETGTRYQSEYRIVRPGRETRWVVARGEVECDASGRPVALPGAVVDITDRKVAEESISFLSRAGAAFVGSVLPESVLKEAADLAVPFLADFCLLDLDDSHGTLRRAGWACRDPRDCAEAEVATPNSVGPPDDPDHPILRAFRSGRPEFHPEMGDGTGRADPRLLGLVPRSLIAVPLVAHDRTFGVATFGIIDRSRRRYAAADLALAEEFARRVAAALESARLYQSLRDADRRKDEFLAMLAHELRNPLAAVNNAVAVLKRTDARESRDWAGEVVERQVRQLARLIDDLLDVSRITSGKIRLRRESIDAGPVLEQAIEAVRPLVEERKHTLVVDFERDRLPLRADPTRLEQIVVNLLTNAAKYTESGGRIWLSAAVEGDEVVIRVRDDGVGIAPELLPQMFVLFAQGDRSLARSEGGLGIGLTLVHRLAELHGGAVSATSDGPGLGSEFTVRLPASARPKAAPSEARTPTAEARKISGSRILVVDDNVDTARGMARLLKLLGNEVRVAHDGPEALELARQARPDFVLLDIGLPGLDGYQVATQLRLEECGRGATIIAVSGYGQDEDKRRSRAAGFDHHLVKPVDFDSLISLIGRTH